PTCERYPACAPAPASPQYEATASAIPYDATCLPPAQSPQLPNSSLFRSPAFVRNLPTPVSLSTGFLQVNLAHRAPQNAHSKLVVTYKQWRDVLMPNSDLPEPWLRGTLTEVPALQRAVLHALELAREDIDRWCDGLTDSELNERPGGIAPVAFHLRH